MKLSEEARMELACTLEDTIEQYVLNAGGDPEDVREIIGMIADQDIPGEQPETPEALKHLVLRDPADYGISTLGDNWPGGEVEFGQGELLDREFERGVKEKERQFGTQVDLEEMGKIVDEGS
jgi:hypothetical protein